MPIHKIKLIGKQEIATNTVLFRFEKPEHFNFIPGQYGGFTLIDPPEMDIGGVTRRFSIASCPQDPSLDIVTRMQNSGYKLALNEMKPGSEIKFAGPTGNFVLPAATDTPIVLIAGGIGIAPFYCMIRDAIATKSTRQLYLFYGNQCKADAAFFSEFEQLSLANPAFHFIPTFDKPDNEWNGEKGFITHTMIKKHLPDILTPIYYICGAPVMVTTLQETLVEMGIEETHIKVEDFPGY